MEVIKRFFGATPTKNTFPQPIETDDVFPVHFLDDTKTLREIVVSWTLRFNDVLDPERLHISLLKLLAIGDWKKLGGRLRLREDGKLEIHVPTPFTPERPAITYTHVFLDFKIDDHPLAKTLPKSSSGPSTQAGPEAFRAFAARGDVPSVLEDFIYSDIPQLSLHITSFNDATLVALAWPHTLMDVMGQQALLQAWSLVAGGREAEVKPMLGAREDAVSIAVNTSAEKEKVEEWKAGALQLKGWSMVKFGLRFAWDMLWNRIVESRTVFLPKTFVADLRRQAQKDLAISDGGEEEVFLSDGDILTAWTVRSIASSLPYPRPVTALHALNARFRIPSINHAPGVFVQNMAIAAFAYFSPEVIAGSLGATALENRSQLMGQSTESQVLACLSYLRHGPHDPSMICGNPDALLVPCTNWRRAKVFESVDFRAAVVRAGDAGKARTNPPGSLVYHHASSLKPNPASRNVFVLLGQDHGGNYWMTGIFLPATWAKIEEEFKKFE